MKKEGPGPQYVHNGHGREAGKIYKMSDCAPFKIKHHGIIHHYIRQETTWDSSHLAFHIIGVL